MRHIIPFNRTVHHAINPKLSLLFWISDWPDQSPDLNIIKPLWSELKARVFSRKSDNIEALCRACEEHWVKIPVPNITNLYESIPGRI